MGGKHKPVDVKTKMQKKWERLQKTIEQNPLTTYEKQKLKNQGKKIEDVGGRH